MFNTPGAIHHVPWMGKAIYSIEIILFRKVFKLTKQEENDLRQICIFLYIYTENWFSSIPAIMVPYNDIIHN